jgi:hypothetical protein
MPTVPLCFKVASEPAEFEQIHRLNYQTFVEEIPQHPPNLERRLVDKFHAENTYLIAQRGELLVGMLALRDQRPFSLDAKLGDLDAWLPPHRALCEVRLLAVAPAHRGPRVLQGLLALVGVVGEQRGYDLAVISGTVRQLKLYHALGFEPFGPLVGAGEAMFQPMVLTLAAYRTRQAGCRALAPGVRRSV